MMDQNKEESDITVGNGHGQYLRNRLSIAPTYHLAFRHCDANKKLYMYICANQFRIWVFVFFFGFLLYRVFCCCFCLSQLSSTAAFNERYNNKATRANLKVVTMLPKRHLVICVSFSFFFFFFCPCLFGKVICLYYNQSFLNTC